MDNEKNNLKEVVVGIDNLNRNVLFSNSLLEKDNLIHLMYEVLTGEIALTNEGLSFLKTYWGFKEIAKILFEYEKEGGDFKINFEKEESLMEWLENYPCYV